MRRLVVLVFLFVGTELLLPLGPQEPGSQTLLAFGFMILAAYTIGEFAAAARLPKIVGYLGAGVLFGPHVLGPLTAEAAVQLDPVNQLAVALIAFLAGAELRWDDVRSHGTALLKIMSVELALAFVAIAALLFAIKGLVPALDGASAGVLISFILLFSAIAIVHSPAVTMALLSETRAQGPVAKTTLGVVLLTDVAVVVLFSGALALARALAPPEGVPGPSVGAVVWEITGALLVGAMLGAAVAAYLRFVGRELILFAVLVAFFGLEIARLAHVELLLTLLTAGFVTESVSPQGEELRDAMERSAAPIFVIFFALSGAKIDLEAVAPLLPLVLPIALARGAAIWAGTQLGGRWAGVSTTERRYVWMGLVSQAGVAIGLASIVANAYGEMGVYLQGLLLALIAVNETVGAVLFRRALDRSGELPEGGRAAQQAPPEEGATPGA